MVKHTPDPKELMLQYAQMRLDPELNDIGIYYDLVKRIRATGSDGIAFLLSKLTDEPDIEKLRAVIHGLTLKAGSEGLYPLTAQQHRFLFITLKDMLDKGHPLVIAEAVDGLARLDVNNVTDLVNTLASHESPYVRGSVLRYLRRTLGKESLPYLIGALKDKDYIVRENAVDEIDELNAGEALPLITEMLKDPHPDVRAAAKTAVEHLASH